MYLIKYVSVVYLFLVVLGGILKKVKPSIIKTFEKSEKQKNTKVEKIFGRYKEELRGGDTRTFFVCAGMLFIVNLFGVITTFTIGSILVLPLLYIFMDGLRQGASIFSIKGSSLFSVVSYCCLVFLEWIAYILGATAGLNIILSIINAIQSNSVSLSAAITNSLYELLALYILIIIVLIVQAITEVFYVRKVLRKGGSAVPLEPY